MSWQLSWQLAPFHSLTSAKAGFECNGLFSTVTVPLSETLARRGVSVRNVSPRRERECDLGKYSPLPLNHHQFAAWRPVTDRLRARLTSLRGHNARTGCRFRDHVLFREESTIQRVRKDKRGSEINRLASTKSLIRNKKDRFSSSLASISSCDQLQRESPSSPTTAKLRSPRLTPFEVLSLF